MKMFSFPSQKTGKIGENIACAYLKNKGFIIIERNYTKKCGEIDIVAEKEGVTHFIEVKSVSCETNEYGPEDMIHSKKSARLRRIIETYILEHQTDEWQFDAVCVYLDNQAHKARVKFLEDLIL